MTREAVAATVAHQDACVCKAWLGDNGPVEVLEKTLQQALDALSGSHEFINGEDYQI